MVKYITRTITGFEFNVIYRDLVTGEMIESIVTVEGTNKEKVQKTISNQYAGNGIVTCIRAVSEKRRISIDDFIRYSTVVDNEQTKLENI